MEDILASIRRILNEDESAPGMTQQPASPTPRPEDVLVLDSSMMVGGQARSEPSKADLTKAELPSLQAPGQDDAEVPAAGAADEEAAMEGEPAAAEMRLTAPEVEAAAAAAAAAAVSGLVKRLQSERGAIVHRGGPTIEDLVREELRPLLKAWLDAHLPGLVERLVRAEIERVLGRIAP